MLTSSTYCLGDGLTAYAPRVQHDLNNTGFWESVLGRLEICSQFHEECQRYSELALPKRLLDLQDPSQPVLVDAAFLPQSLRYAALSYCWGGARFLRTLTTNIEQHNKAISLDTLPVLFQDIITISRRLEIRYLWIDSLCIIQDSAADWEVESSKMHHIFSNSFVVLAPSNSETPHIGLLFDRPKPVLVDTISSSAADDSGSDDDDDAQTGHYEYPIFARESIEHISWAHDNKLRDHRYLENRAWCFQEAVLAKRVLYLLDKEIQIKCGKAWYCECLGDECPLGVHDEALRYLRLTQDSKDEKNLGSLLYSHDQWARLVGDYSRLDISFPSDRLPAFGGIAAAFRQNRLGRYLAGTWESHLPESLFWERADLDGHVSGNMPKRLQEPIAPSWSWVSLNCGVLYMFHGVEFHDDDAVIDAGCCLAGEDPYGRISDGYVKLRARLAVPMAITYARGKWTVRPTSAFRTPESDALIK